MNTASIEKLREDLTFEDTLCGQHLHFHSTWGLFSPREVDEGSRLLLSHIDLQPDADCLDLGCGYGVIGLTLAKLAAAGHTTLVDKDFVAIDYCRKNIALNQINNAEAILSNGFDAIRDRRFDVIASNIPAKVGNELMTLFFYDAQRQLKPGGQIYVVTINGLREYIKRVFKERFGNYTKLKQGRNYTVALATVE
jgi:16S rRNA (guanine1207-N2)-methyltransferase